MAIGAGIRFGLLGPLYVALDGREVEINSAKQGALLAILLINHNQQVTTDRLIEWLWDGDAPKTARSALQVHVSNLRKTLGADVIATTSNGYRMDLVEETIDVFRFEGLAEDGRKAFAELDYHRAVTLLQDAVDLWRGPALEDFAFELWAQPETARLDELFIAARINLLESRMGLGERGLGPEIQQLIAEHPYRENLRALQARSLYREGMQAAALRAIDSTRRVLAEELGLELSPELRALEQRILEQSPDLDSLERGWLPAMTTSFVGREMERDEVTRLLKECRMVTLVGTAGVGKTRLALEVATEAAMRGEAVRWVGLSSIEDGALIDRHVLQHARLRDQPGMSLRESLISAIGQQSMLIVLDTTEHLVEAVADLTAGLVFNCPNLRLLATGRQPIRLAEEAIVTISPLDADEGHDAPAVRLLFDRMRQSAPEVVSSEFLHQDLVDLCHRLDGLPLAIEVAAARVRDLGMRGLIDELETLSRAGSLPERLWETVQWSYRLLGAGSRHLFDRLAIFRGSFDVSAAQHVVAQGDVTRAEVLDYLTLLVDRSLVVAESTTVGRRYRLLDVIRGFAIERLNTGARDEVATLHAEHYMDLAVSSREVVRGGSGQADRLHLLDLELPNLRAAGRWTSGRSDRLVLRAATALMPYWQAADRRADGIELIREARESTHEKPACLLVEALVTEAMLSEIDEGQEKAEDLAREALELANASCPELVYQAMYGIAHANFNYREPAVAVDLGQMAAKLAEDAGDMWFTGWAWMTAGTALYEMGRPEESIALLERAWDVLADLGDSFGLGWTTWCLGIAERHLGRRDAHDERMNDALAIFRRVGDQFGAASALYSLAESAWLRGDRDRAKELYAKVASSDSFGPDANRALVYGRLALLALDEGQHDEAVALIQGGLARLTPGFSWAVAEICLPIGSWALQSDEIDQAAPLVVAAMRHMEEHGTTLDPDTSELMESLINQMERELGGAATAQARAEAEELSEEDVLEALRVLVT